MGALAPFFLAGGVSYLFPRGQKRWGDLASDGSPCLFWGEKTLPHVFNLKGGVLSIFLGDVVFWGERERFPCLGGERKLVPSFSWGSLFRAKLGLHPFRERKRGLRALAGGERGVPPLPFIKCEMGSPHALLWRVIKGPTPRVSGRGWGPVSPASAQGWGAVFVHPFLVGQGKR